MVRRDPEVAKGGIVGVGTLWVRIQRGKAIDQVHRHCIDLGGTVKEP